MTETERADRAEAALGTLQTALREVTLERDKANAAADRYCSQWIDVLKAAKSVVPAEAAVGTLQTALRQLVETWRYRRDVERITAESQAAREAELLEHSADGYDACADELESLLPALEPTP